MSRHWLGQSERGSKFMLRLITWIALRLGRAPARALLYPICGYFIVFSRHARRA
jgi:predicted LPLAT superfamily acyltransferase